MSTQKGTWLNMALPRDLREKLGIICFANGDKPISVYVRELLEKHVEEEFNTSVVLLKQQVDKVASH